MKSPSVGLAVVWLVAAAASAAAQGTVSGTVRDSLKQPVADVEVSIASLDRRTRTDSVGRYSFGDVAEGSYVVRARRIGFFPVERKATVAGPTVSVDFALEHRPVMLDTVKVAAECARFQFAGFTCRRRDALARGKGGVFFDVDAIDSVKPRFPIDMIREVPGLRVVAARAGRGLAVESTNDLWCTPVVLANGKRPSRANPLPQWPNETIGIEIYANPDDVPKEYKQFSDPPHRCPVINYWTTVRPRKMGS